MKDMSQKQFDEACERNGFKPQGFMGYYNLGIEGRNTNVSILNAGNKRRDQLAYLLRERERILKQPQPN